MKEYKVLNKKNNDHKSTKRKGAKCNYISPIPMITAKTKHAIIIISPTLLTAIDFTVAEPRAANAVMGGAVAFLGSGSTTTEIFIPPKQNPLQMK